MPPSRILVVAARTATSDAVLCAVRERASQGPTKFHLVVPATPRGLHRLVDPEVAGLQEAERRLAAALPILSEAAGHAVTGHVGDANPLAAFEDAAHIQGYDEVIVSTLPRRMSRWLRLDLPSKVRAHGLPTLHVTADEVADGPLSAAA
jgi:hypothetical protein